MCSRKGSKTAWGAEEWAFSMQVHIYQNHSQISDGSQMGHLLTYSANSNATRYPNFKERIV